MNKFISKYLNIIVESNQYDDHLISYFSNINNFKKLIKSKDESDFESEHLKLFETDKVSAIKSALEWKKLKKDNNSDVLFYAERVKPYLRSRFYWYNISSGKIYSEFRNYYGKTAVIAEKMFSKNEPYEKIYNTVVKYGSWV